VSREPIKKALKNFGLTEKETEIYIFLAKYGVLTGGEISKKCKMLRPHVYRILKRLQKKGVVEATLESPTRFFSVPFEKILDKNIRTKREEFVSLEKAKSSLIDDWKKLSTKEIVPAIGKFVVIEGSKKIYSKIIQMIEETKRQLSAILSVPGLARGEQFGIFDAAYEHPMKSDIEFQFLTDLPKKYLKAVKLLVPKLKCEISLKAITLSPNSGSLPRMVIRDGEEILFFISPKTDVFSTGQDDACLFINSKSLVQTLCKTFEDFWKDSTYIEDRIFEIETGRILPEPLVKKDVDILTNYDATLNTVKKQMSSLPLLTAQIARIERSLPEFVGRQKEFNLLKNCLEKVLEGKGNTILINGEAGIGKTRLVDELILHALSNNFKVLKCVCSQKTGISLQPFRKVFMDIFDVSKEDSLEFGRERIKNQIEDVAPQLTCLIPFVNNILSNFNKETETYPAEIKESAQENLALFLKSETNFVNLAKLLVHFAEKQPIMLFIDDMHLADSSSLKLFKNLAKLVNKSNLLLIGAYRKEALMKTIEGIIHPLFNTLEILGSESLCEKIELKRLTQLDCIKLISNMLGIYDYNFAKLIHEETEGNPFFILETIKFLINKKILILNGEKWEFTKKLSEIELPHSIRDVLSRRIYILREEERDVIDCASVIGDEFTSDLIDDVTGFNRLQVLKRLNRIERKYQLIHSFDDKYRFDHSRIREFLYQNLTPELKKEYHLLIAEKLEENYKKRLSEVINQLAYHYYNSVNFKKAVPYLLKAGKKSEQEWAIFETLQYYSQALEIMKDDEQWKSERTTTLETIGELYGFFAEHKLANECYLKGIASTNDELSKNRMRRKIRVKKIVENKGVKLSYYVYGDGEPVILFFSWTSSSQLWIPQITYFSQKCKVVTLDMRGTGESDKPPGKYTADVHVEDLKSIIDDLQVKNLVIVGGHYGGKIAVKYVTQYPENISKLVLADFDPEPFIEHCDKKKFENYRKMAMNSPSWFVNGFWVTSFPDPKFKSLIEWGLKSAQRTPPEIFRDGVYNIWDVDVRPLLDKIDIPTLIIEGDKNRSYPDKVKYLQKRIPKSQIHVFKGMKTSFINVFEADKFNKILDKFIAIGIPKK
jgi:pimeloyl-ACP methyl ester carboxylesterase/sugar-specific transcriptional regulator TrmB